MTSSLQARIAVAADRRAWVVAVCGLQVASLALLTRNGMYVTGDGEGYLGMARAFGVGNFALDASSAPVPYSGLRVHWPPGYPMLLELCSSLTGLTLTQSASAVNAVSLVGITIGVQRLVRTVWPAGHSPGSWSLVITANAALGAPTIFMATRVLPETTFTAAAVWFLVSVVLLARRTAPVVLSVTVLLGLLLVSLKWAGLFFVAGAALGLGLADLRRRRLPLVPAVVAVSAGLGWWAWMAWIRSFPGGPLSEHGRSGVLGATVSVLESVVAFGSSAMGILQGRAGGVLGRGSFPLPSPLAGAAFAASAVLGALLLGAFAMSTWRQLKLVARSGVESGPQHADGMLAVMCALVAYIALNVVTRARWGYFVLPRYWGIMPVVCWLLVGADFIDRSERAQRIVWTGAAAATGSSLAGTAYLLI